MNIAKRRNAFRLNDKRSLYPQMQQYGQSKNSHQQYISQNEKALLKWV